MGKAFCFYYRAVLEGHVPTTEDLRRYYKDQYAKAQEAWKHMYDKTPGPAGKQ